MHGFGGSTIRSFCFYGAFLLLALYCNSQRRSESIAFYNFGPVAFDSFWRLPDTHISKQTAIAVAPRFTFDSEQNQFTTTYLRGDFPIGAGHSIAVRLPFHSFNVNQATADSLEMASREGSEFGDIDIIFNIRFLHSFLERTTNGLLSSYLTAELHTAPTGRANKQFTDVLKMLGTLNLKVRIADKGQGKLYGLFTIGGGGWDDIEAPFQKHALKLSGKVQYDRKLNKDRLFQGFVGNTFVRAEGKGNQGNRFVTGVIYGGRWKAGLQYLFHTYEGTAEFAQAIQAQLRIVISNKPSQEEG